MLMFDTLVTVDDNGHVQPSLATSWQALAGGQRGQLRIRRGVKFNDGTPLTPEIAASSLRAANPSWNVAADADSVVIDISGQNLLEQLALPRNAIAKRTADNRPIGTGPFHIVDWQPGKKLALAAEDTCWRGRPFLDAVEIEMGRGFREQMTALQLGKADLVEVAPEQTHRVSLDGRRLVSSNPIDFGLSSSLAMWHRRMRNSCVTRWPAASSEARCEACCCRARDNQQPAFFQIG